MQQGPASHGPSTDRDLAASPKFANNQRTVIVGSLSLARDDLRRGVDISEQLDDIQRAADSAASLVRQLLSFSRRPTQV